MSQIPTPWSILQKELGSQASMLDQLAVDRLDFQPHNDRVVLSRTKGSIIPFKINVGTTIDQDGSRIIVWAYMFENWSANSCPKITYRAIRSDNSEIHFKEMDVIQQATVHPAFPKGCQYDELTSIVKCYFYKKGITLPYPVTVADHSLRATVRGCKKFSTTTLVSERNLGAQDLDRIDPTLSGLTKSRDIVQPLIPTPLAPTRSRIGTISAREDAERKNVTAFNGFGAPFSDVAAQNWHGLDTSDVGISSTKNTKPIPRTGHSKPNPLDDVQTTFLLPISRASEKQMSHEKRLQEISEAKATENEKISAHEKEVRELEGRIATMKGWIGVVKGNIGTLHAEESAQLRMLEEAKKTKKRVLEDSEPGLKAILEYGIRLGLEQGELKRRKMGT